VFSYVFNPVSFWLCHDREQRLRAVLAEVNNTFGQRHSYLIPVEANGRRMIEQSCAKRLYVSPFNDMEMSYQFKVLPPGETIAVGIDALDPRGLLITTALSGKRKAFSDGAILSTFLAHPLLTLKVIVAIHWEALRLWLKGVKLVPRPDPAAAKAHNTSLASGKNRAYITEALSDRGGALWSGDGR